MKETEKCPDCGKQMKYVDEDPEFGHLGWICTNNDCGRV